MKRGLWRNHPATKSQQQLDFEAPGKRHRQPTQADVLIGMLRAARAERHVPGVACDHAGRNRTARRALQRDFEIEALRSKTKWCARRMEGCAPAIGSAATRSGTVGNEPRTRTRGPARKAQRPAQTQSSGRTIPAFLPVSTRAYCKWGKRYRDPGFRRWTLLAPLGRAH
jgi:hypothetical protein